MRKKKTSETNEDALKVSLILGGLHLTLYAALVKHTVLRCWQKLQQVFKPASCHL